MLVLVGDEINDTQYVNHLFGEFLRQKLSLNVQRVAGTQQRAQNLMKQMAESSQHTSVQQSHQSAQNLAQKIFKFDASSTGNEEKPNLESQQGSKLKKTQKLIFFEDVDTIFEDEKSEQFYGQLAKLIHNSKVPIVASCYQKKDEAYLEFLDHICDGGLNGLGLDIPYQVCQMQPTLKVPCELDMTLKFIQAFERTFDNATIVKVFSRANAKETSNGVRSLVEQIQESCDERESPEGTNELNQLENAGLFTMMNHLQLNRSSPLDLGMCMEKKQGATYEYDDVRNLHGYRLEQGDPLQEEGDDVEDLGKLADRLEDVSAGTDLQFRIEDLLEKEEPRPTPLEKQSELLRAQTNCHKALTTPHQVYIQQEYFHRVEVHVFKAVHSSLFCLCKLNFNKNQRQSCIRREQTELSSKMCEGKVFRLADQPLILEKISPKSRIEWALFKEFEEELQAKI